MNTDYSIIKLRCIAIIVVVFGHSIILYDPQWGIYSTTYTVSSLMWIKRLINTFQMPLFLFLSGFCFFYSSQKYGYKNVRSIIQGILCKAKRLLIPFFVVTIFWMIPIRFLCNYVPWANLNLIQIFKRVFLGLDSGHLWFLPTLFSIFIIAFLVLPRVVKKLGDFLVLLISFMGILVAPKLPTVLFMSNVASSLYWFCLGFEVCKYKKKVKDIGDTGIKYVLLIMASILIFLIIRGGVNSVTGKLFKEIAVTFLLTSSYNCVSSSKCSKVCELISKESMGIYLLHSPLIYFTYSYCSNEFPLVVVFINFVIDGSIAVLLTNFLMKGKGKWLIGY